VSTTYESPPPAIEIEAESANCHPVQGATSGTIPDLDEQSVHPPTASLKAPPVIAPLSRKRTADGPLPERSSKPQPRLCNGIHRKEPAEKSFIDTVLYSEGVPNESLPAKKVRARRCLETSERKSRHNLRPDDLLGLSINFSENDEYHGKEGKIVGYALLLDKEELEGAAFTVQVGDKEIEMQYNEFEQDINWPIREIEAHEDTSDGPMIKIKWKNCGKAAFAPSWEPLIVIAQGAPDPCIEYAVRKDLLNMPGWRFLKEHDQENLKDDTEAEEVASSSSGDSKTVEENDDLDDDCDDDVAVAISQDTSPSFQSYTRKNT
jgi:hypothetical protein